MDRKDNPRRRIEVQSVTEQAAEWLITLEERGEEANPAFADWLRESPTHVQAYLRAATLDTMIKRVDPERSIETPKPVPGTWIPDIEPELSEALLEQASPQLRRPVPWRLAAAVAALGLLLTSSWM